MNGKIEASIRSRHEHFLGLYSAVQSEVRELVKEACEQNGWVFQDRLKELRSFALKVLDGRYENYEIDDFYACTIVVPNLVSIEPALALIRSTFKVIDEKPGAEIKSRPTEFNFDSIRLYCTLPQSVKPQQYSGRNFEIQVKTLLEHAWSKATHDFAYKGNEVSWAKERLSAQIKAILDNADLSILEMERISASSILDKRNPKYTKLQNIVEYLKSEFTVSPENQSNEDYKRLAGYVDSLLTRVGASLDELKDCMSSEVKLGRGSKMLNFSAYSIVLLSLINQLPDRVTKAFRKAPVGRRKQSIVIPKEVMREWEVDTSKFRHVIILN